MELLGRRVRSALCGYMAIAWLHMAVHGYKAMAWHRCIWLPFRVHAFLPLIRKLNENFKQYSLFRWKKGSILAILRQTRHQSRSRDWVHLRATLRKASQLLAEDDNWSKAWSASGSESRTLWSFPVLDAVIINGHKPGATIKCTLLWDRVLFELQAKSSMRLTLGKKCSEWYVRCSLWLK